MVSIRARVRFVAFVCALSISAPAYAGSCTLKRFAAFDIPSNPAGDVRIPVTINGTEEPFLVDTGGVVSMLSPTVADALHMKPLRLNRYVEMYAMDGSVLDKYVNVDTFGMGAAQISNVKFVLMPKHSDTGMDTLKGTLAPDLLRNFDLDFDFANHKLNLISPDHCKGKVVYWASSYAALPFSMIRGDEHIRVPVELDGQKFLAVVDTGSSHTILLADAARNHFGLEPGGSGMEPIPGTSDSSLARYYHRFKVLDMNGVAVKNPVIVIVPNAAKKSFWKHHTRKADRDPVYGTHFDPEPIVLGMDVLRKLHLYVAYGEKTLYVTAANPGKAAPAQPASSN